MELIKHAKLVNLRLRPIRIWNNQKVWQELVKFNNFWNQIIHSFIHYIHTLYLYIHTFIHTLQYITFFCVSIVAIWTLIFTLGNHQALGSGCNPNPDNKNKAIFRWAFSLQNRRDFVGFQANGSKRELGAKCKSFLLSLAWKNLKQKLTSFQVKVDLYKI